MSSSAPSAPSAALAPFRRTLFHQCPGGLCAFIQMHSLPLLVILITTGLAFLSTLIPFIFSWRKRKADGKKRVFMAFLSCATFYFWLTFLVLNSVYCFGFLAHEGPCRDFVREDNASVHATFSPETNATTRVPPPITPITSEDYVVIDGSSSEVLAEPLLAINDSCAGAPAQSPHEESLWHVTLINGIIIIVLIVVLLANAKEGKYCTSLPRSIVLHENIFGVEFLSIIVNKENHRYKDILHEKSKK